jgi:hypothetical protein
MLGWEAFEVEAGIFSNVASSKAGFWSPAVLVKGARSGCHIKAYFDHFIAPNKNSLPYKTYLFFL